MPLLRASRCEKEKKVYLLSKLHPSAKKNPRRSLETTKISGLKDSLFVSTSFAPGVSWHLPFFLTSFSRPVQAGHCTTGCCTTLRALCFASHSTSIEICCFENVSATHGQNYCSPCTMPVLDFQALRVGIHFRD